MRQLGLRLLCGLLALAMLEIPAGLDRLLSVAHAEAPAPIDEKDKEKEESKESKESLAWSVRSRQRRTDFRHSAPLSLVAAGPESYVGGGRLHEPASQAFPDRHNGSGSHLRC